MCVPMVLTRQFSTIQELMQQVEHSWFPLQPYIYQILVRNMPDRMIQTN